MIFIIDEKTGTAYYHFNSSDEVGFIPLPQKKDGIQIIDTNEGGVVDIWESKEEEERIKLLLNHK